MSDYKKVVAIRHIVLTVFDPWITGPSAIGSLNGTPSSMISAPPASIASMRGTVLSTLGKPAVRKVTKALLRWE
jgi:hypothetical protein